MIDLQTSPEHRLVRVFLSRNEPVTFEVYADVSSSLLEYACTCPGFGVRRTCKHVEHVKAMDTEAGHAAVLLEADHRIDPEEALEALADPVMFRAWVLRWGRVAVL